MYFEVDHLELPNGPEGSEGDPECIFFILETYQTTFNSDNLWYACRNWRYYLETQTYGYTYAHAYLETEKYLCELEKLLF